MIQKKKDTINSLAIHKKDVGSAEVQIGLLSNKIEKLAVHFKKFKKDKHSTMGLTKSVNKRKKLLSYLKKKKPDSYDKIIKQLDFTYTQLRFERDLLSWKMNFSWVPFGPRTSWNFFIGIKSSLLQDLKYDKRKMNDRQL